MKTLVFPESTLSTSIARQFHYDSWLVERFLKYVPDIDSFLKKMEMTPSVYVRVNTLKSTVENVMKVLQQKGFEPRPTVLDEVLQIARQPMSIGATTEYMLGHYYVQDLSSCLAVEALDPRPGETILDAAAAPGGKTTHIAQRMENSGEIIALEPNKKRARSMSFNLSRMGVINACLCALDARKASTLGMQFDRVLLDAPCSCEGVIARDPARKTSHTPADVEYCSERQHGLLEAACEVVRPGGTLVYSTCSFAPEENEVIIDSLLRRRSGLEIEPVEFGSPGLTTFGDLEFDDSLSLTRRLYPHIHDTTGFFVAKLKVG